MEVEKSPHTLQWHGKLVDKHRQSIDDVCMYGKIPLLKSIDNSIAVDQRMELNLLKEKVLPQMPSFASEVEGKEKSQIQLVQIQIYRQLKVSSINQVDKLKLFLNKTKSIGLSSLTEHDIILLVDPKVLQQLNIPGTLSGIPKDDSGIIMGIIWWNCNLRLYLSPSSTRGPLFHDSSSKEYLGKKTPADDTQIGREMNKTQVVDRRGNFPEIVIKQEKIENSPHRNSEKIHFRGEISGEEEAHIPPPSSDPSSPPWNSDSVNSFQGVVLDISNGLKSEPHSPMDCEGSECRSTQMFNSTVNVKTEPNDLLPPPPIVVLPSFRESSVETEDSFKPKTVADVLRWEGLPDLVLASRSRARDSGDIENNTKLGCIGEDIRDIKENREDPVCNISKSLPSPNEERLAECDQSGSEKVGKVPERRCSHKVKKKKSYFVKGKRLLDSVRDCQHIKEKINEVSLGSSQRMSDHLDSSDTKSHERVQNKKNLEKKFNGIQDTYTDSRLQKEPVVYLKRLSDRHVKVKEFLGLRKSKSLDDIFMLSRDLSPFRTQSRSKKNKRRDRNKEGGSLTSKHLLKRSYPLDVEDENVLQKKRKTVALNYGSVLKAWGIKLQTNDDDRTSQPGRTLEDNVKLNDKNKKEKTFLDREGKTQTAKHKERKVDKWNAKDNLERKEFKNPGPKETKKDIGKALQSKDPNVEVENNNGHKEETSKIPKEKVQDENKKESCRDDGETKCNELCFTRYSHSSTLECFENFKENRISVDNLETSSVVSFAGTYRDTTDAVFGGSLKRPQNFGYTPRRRNVLKPRVSAQGKLQIDRKLEKLRQNVKKKLTLVEIKMEDGAGKWLKESQGYLSESPEKVSLSKNTTEHSTTADSKQGIAEGNLKREKTCHVFDKIEMGISSKFTKSSPTCHAKDEQTIGSVLTAGSPRICHEKMPGSPNSQLVSKKVQLKTAEFASINKRQRTPDLHLCSPLKGYPIQGHFMNYDTQGQETPESPLMSKEKHQGTPSKAKGYKTPEGLLISIAKQQKIQESPMIKGYQTTGSPMAPIIKPQQTPQSPTATLVSETRGQTTGESPSEKPKEIKYHVADVLQSMTYLQPEKINWRDPRIQIKVVKSLANALGSPEIKLHEKNYHEKESEKKYQEMKRKSGLYALAKPRKDKERQNIDVNKPPVKRNSEISKLSQLTCSNNRRDSLGSPPLKLKCIQQELSCEYDDVHNVSEKSSDYSACDKDGKRLGALGILKHQYESLIMCKSNSPNAHKEKAVEKAIVRKEKTSGKIHFSAASVHKETALEKASYSPIVHKKKVPDWNKYHVVHDHSEKTLDKPYSYIPSYISVHKEKTLYKSSSHFGRIYLKALEKPSSCSPCVHKDNKNSPKIHAENSQKEVVLNLASPSKEKFSGRKHREKRRERKGLNSSDCKTKSSEVSKEKISNDLNVCKEISTAKHLKFHKKDYKDVEQTDVCKRNSESTKEQRDAHHKSDRLGGSQSAITKPQILVDKADKDFVKNIPTVSPFHSLVQSLGSSETALAEANKGGQIAETTMSQSIIQKTEISKIGTSSMNEKVLESEVPEQGQNISTDVSPKSDSTKMKDCKCDRSDMKNDVYVVEYCKHKNKLKVGKRCSPQLSPKLNKMSLKLFVFEYSKHISKLKMKQEHKNLKQKLENSPAQKGLSANKSETLKNVEKKGTDKILATITNPPIDQSLSDKSPTNSSIDMAKNDGYGDSKAMKNVHTDQPRQNIAQRKPNFELSRGHASSGDSHKEHALAEEVTRNCQTEQSAADRSLTNCNTEQSVAQVQVTNKNFQKEQSAVETGETEDSVGIHAVSNCQTELPIAQDVMSYCQSMDQTPDQSVDTIVALNAMLHGVTQDMMRHGQTQQSVAHNALSNLNKEMVRSVDTMQSCTEKSQDANIAQDAMLTGIAKSLTKLETIQKHIDTMQHCVSQIGNFLLDTMNEWPTVLKDRYTLLCGTLPSSAQEPNRNNSLEMDKVNHEEMHKENALDLPSSEVVSQMCESLHELQKETEPSSKETSSAATSLEKGLDSCQLVNCIQANKTVRKTYSEESCPSDSPKMGKGKMIGCINPKEQYPSPSQIQDRNSLEQYHANSPERKCTKDVQKAHSSTPQPQNVISTLKHYESTSLKQHDCSPHRQKCDNPTVIYTRSPEILLQSKYTTICSP